MKRLLIVALLLSLAAPGCAARSRAGRRIPGFVFLDCELIKKENGKASCSCPRPVSVAVDARTHATIYDCKSNGGTK